MRLDSGMGLMGWYSSGAGVQLSALMGLQHMPAWYLGTTRAGVNDFLTRPFP